MINDFDFIISRKSGLMGIVLTKDILFIHENQIISFRIKPENILKTRIKDLTALKFKKEDSIDKDFLEHYFSENNDNPFAAQFIFQLTQRGHKIDESTINTQFPPLVLDKTEDSGLNEKLKQIIQKLQPGDLILMFDRQSNISKKIRQIDFCQWSHSCNVYKGSIVQDMTTSGIMRYDISEINPYTNDIAFYRLIDVNSQEISKIIVEMDRLYEMKPKYNWNGVAKAYLYKKYRMFRFLKPKNTWKGRTGFDLINSNMLKLIDYV